MIAKMKHSGGRMPLTSLVLVILISRARVYGRLNVNVALNRPTFSSTLHSNQYATSKAVNGNKDTYITSLSCFHTADQDNNPWWAVDLGAALVVVGVLYTNRGDCCGYRSNNFIVGLTDVSPAITAPTLWNYDVCAQYPGVVGDGATVYLSCTSCMPPRRYLIVQVELVNDALNFCEIEVYVGRWQWYQGSGKRMINKLASTFQVDHRLQFMLNCTLSPICDSYNYRADDKTCQFNTHDTPLIANSADIVDDSAWGWWSAQFIQVV